VLNLFLAQAPVILPLLAALQALNTLTLAGGQTEIHPQHLPHSPRAITDAKQGHRLIKLGGRPRVRTVGHNVS
jgi:hypothetical protein